MLLRYQRQRETLHFSEEDLSRFKNLDKPSYDSAVGLVTLQNLRTLHLDGVRLSESFYRGLATGGVHAQVGHNVSLD